MACDNRHAKDCPCTYPCQYHGKCCACIANHRPDEFPACFFSKAAEATYDRSYRALKRDREA